MSSKKPHEAYMAAQEDAAAQNLFEQDTEEFTLPQVPENLNELCLEHICPSCSVKEDADQTRLRALAEMENYKKRLAREHEEQLTYAAEKVLSSLLPSLDNLDLALQYGGQNEACKDMLMGIEMTRKLLLEAVKNHGLEPVGEVGEEFTPELHEGLIFETREDLEENRVSNVMQRGYKLKGRLIRPAKVSISKKP